ncbi:PREDICTED: uncharacterized protein LOC108557436 [Nicrophorus vespilloides]|uniref:Uncharacterized protein LOC108557436 n=1 Tax=Nicrophorus vespilloides TaxID=110193 RepID=A0ABM1M4D0_NICVS|nr:PREDICTED: uncharacterized protein LOC108557436 [Nicrophorus vespilloides]
MLIRCALLFSMVTVGIASNDTYVCKNFVNYAYAEYSPHCKKNGNTIMDMPELAMQYCKVERYQVITEDKYNLTVFRLKPKGGKAKGVVYLQHPATASCTCWVDKGWDDSLGLKLHKAGYDVWLGNFRGSYYSRSNLDLKPDQNQFWNFSYHEMGIYDVPQQIDLIHKVTQRNDIVYVGHSMASTAAVIYASLKPEHASKYVKAFLLMGPAIYMAHLRTPIKYLAYFKDPIYKMAEELKMLEVFERNLNKTNFCRDTSLGIFLCTELSQIFMGPDSGYVYAPMASILWGQNPTSVSLKSVLHYSQSITNNGTFKFFDYGKKGNRVAYDQDTAPDYPIHKMNSSFMLFVGENDFLANVKDNTNFYNAIPPTSTKLGLHKLKGFNHAHFMYGKDLDELINTPVLNEINKLYMRNLGAICFVAFLLRFGFAQRPNVCRNFVDYITLNPKNCWYNPLVDADAEDLIVKNGYSFEKYEPVTEDGYILTMYRIPRRNPKGIVFLQHPATASCTGWIDKGNSSLGFILWNAGYDVWLGNFRGNYYSRHHVNLYPNEYKFWNYSFHELGVIDIPTMLKVVVDVTNAKPKGISFVGYSMASTSALIYASTFPEESMNLLNVMILMAPAAYMNNAHFMLKHLSRFTKDLEIIADRIQLGEIIPKNRVTGSIQTPCKTMPLMFFCHIMDMVTFGNTERSLEAEYFPIRNSQNPAGLSVKCYFHYLYLINSGKFQKYDYGVNGNMKLYGSSTPPDYDISKIKCPVHVMYAELDQAVPAKDVLTLLKMLPERTKIYGSTFIPDYSHIGFFYGVDVVNLVYKPVLKLINHIFDNLNN